MKRILFLLTFLVILSTEAQKINTKKIDSLITISVQENHPGVAVGIIKNGKIIFESYRGLANLQHQVKFDEKTRSNIASTAKQFTALMVLDLSLNGKITLEDDIRKYLNKLYPKVKEEIKIRHLLNHTSGIRDYVELLDMDGTVWWQRFGLSNDAVMELLENQNDLGFTPGSNYFYSNSNYIVLTKIIEKVTGKTFNEYSKTFFENLGMKETAFVEKYMKVIPNRANPYSDWGRGEWWEVPTVTKTNGEGFLYTTLKDQMIYEQAVQNAKVNNNILLIDSQQPIANSEIKTYGFGLELNNVLGRFTVHHSGGTYGYHSQTYRFINEKLSIFIMSNNGNISSNLLAKQIAQIVLPKGNEEAKYDTKFYENTISSNNIYGKYTYPLENKMVEILKKENKIYWKEKNFTVEIVSEDKNIYSFKNNRKLKVRFYPTKLKEFYASGNTKVYLKSNATQPSFADLENIIGTYFNKELKINFDIKLSKNYTLKFKLSSDNSFSNVVVHNKDYISANNYFLKLKRDVFNRVVEVELTYGRALRMTFKKKTNLKFQPKIKTKSGSIQVSTIRGKQTNSSQILVTKNDENGNEIWYKKFGGTSYDKANSIIKAKDGYLIIGSTSSYGNGNYDMYALKIDTSGKKVWQNTYGGFYNEYGYAAEKTPNGYILKGTKQKCPNNTDIHRICTTNTWFVSIDKNGKEISNKILEILE